MPEEDEVGDGGGVAVALVSFKSTPCWIWSAIESKMLTRRLRITGTCSLSNFARESLLEFERISWSGLDRTAVHSSKVHSKRKRPMTAVSLLWTRERMSLIKLGRELEGHSSRPTSAMTLPVLFLTKEGRVLNLRVRNFQT